jgi:hypothetical protein
MGLFSKGAALLIRVVLEPLIGRFYVSKNTGPIELGLWFAL